MVRTRIPSVAVLAVLVTAAMGAETPSSDKPVPSTSSPEPGQATVDPVSTPPEVGPVSSAHNWYWVRADYLGWWLTGSRLPPLVTTSPPGTPRDQAGVLGAPGTEVLFGDETVNDDFRSGVRITVGGWLDNFCTTGFELRGLVLDRRSDPFAAGSPDGSAIVSRPFLDAATGRQNAELVSFPGVLAGAVFVADAESDKFWAFDALCRKNCCRDCTGYIDLLAGYRYLQFGDHVRVFEQLQPLATPGSRFNLVDEFNAANRFHGAVVGLAAGYTYGMVTVDARAGIALGETTRTVSINGATQIVTPEGTTTAPGGLLALPTNIGVYRSSDWTVVSDFELTIGCWLTRCCRVMVGYSFLYWPGVARAGEQIDFAVNPSQLPPGTLVGPARPAFVLYRSDLWAHGFSIGAEFRY
jgi:Putative beta barrel porin-7 (BBP7)